LEPVSLKRVFFWVTYVIGNMNLAFGLLFGLVPRSRHLEDFDMDLIIWGICSCLFLSSCFLIRRIFDPKLQEKEGIPEARYFAFMLLAFGELLFALFRVIVFLILILRTR